MKVSAQSVINIPKIKKFAAYIYMYSVAKNLNHFHKDRLSWVKNMKKLKWLATS
jgi:hypothetical protein